MRRGVFRFARTKDQCEQKRCEASGFVNHDTTRKIDSAHLCKEATAPNPMGDGCVDQQHPSSREGEHEPKADTFDICADDQGRGDDCECHLEGKEQHFGDGARNGICINASEEHLGQAAPKCAFAAKCN